MTSLDFFLPESVGAEATEERGREDDGVRKVAEDIDRLDGTAAAEEDARLLDGRRHDQTPQGLPKKGKSVARRGRERSGRELSRLSEHYFYERTTTTKMDQKLNQKVIFISKDTSSPGIFRK